MWRVSGNKSCIIGTEGALRTEYGTLRNHTGSPNGPAEFAIGSAPAPGPPWMGATVSSWPIVRSVVVTTLLRVKAEVEGDAIALDFVADAGRQPPADSDV